MEELEKNELLFKNVSKMNEEEISAFQSFALKKTIILSSLALILFFSAIGAGLLFVDTFLGIAVIVCGVLGGGVLMPFLTKDSVKKQNRLVFGDKKYLNNFEFYSDYLFTTSNATASKESNDYEQVASQKVNYSDASPTSDLQNVYIFICKQSSKFCIKPKRNDKRHSWRTY